MWCREFLTLEIWHVSPVLCRDLKVENVLMGPDGLWKLCDFGSTSVNHKHFDTPDEMGLEEDFIRKYTTPAYRAPEVSQPSFLLDETVFSRELGIFWDSFCSWPSGCFLEFLIKQFLYWAYWKTCFPCGIPDVGSLSKAAYQWESRYLGKMATLVLFSTALSTQMIRNMWWSNITSY